MGERRRRRDERGETLIESLLSIAIVAVVGIAAFAGIQAAIRSSSLHEESAVSETLLRTAAERLQDPETPYEPRAGCGGGAPYDALLPSRSGYDLAVSEVRFWVPTSSGDPAPWSTTFAQPGTPADCPAADPGLQWIELRVDTPSGFVQELHVVKRRG